MPSDNAKPLPSFTTTDGKRYTVSVTYGTIKRVTDETGVLLTDLFVNEGAIAALFGQDARFVEVLVSLVRPQLAGTEAEFLDTIDGAVIEQAADALLEGVVDFFPEPRKGLFAKVLAKSRAAAEKRRTAGGLAAAQVIEEMDFDSLPLTPGSSASSSPASAA